jgi:uracil-DNA glycosylase family 4
MDPKKRLAVLKQDWLSCTRCELSHGRQGNIVFGAGSPTPRYLFVYDAPTEDDVACESPLSGEFGNYYANILRDAQIDIAQCYCTPVLGCRPTALIPATEDMPERIVDRGARAEEVKACRERLDGIIYAVDPLLIFALGDLAWKTLVRPKDRGGHTSLDKAISSTEVVMATIGGKLVPELQYPVMPLPSVKQIIASPSMAKHGTIGVTTRHLAQGKAYVNYVKKSDEQDLTNRSK